MLSAAPYMTVNCKKGILDGSVTLRTAAPFSLCVGVQAQRSTLLGARTLQALKVGCRTKEA